MPGITRRDLLVALVSVAGTAATLGVLGASRATPVAAVRADSILHSTTYNWESIPVRTTNVGALRDLVRQRTATLEELEMHVTTLNAGQTSHAPHRHYNEELVIIREGTVEVLNAGVWVRLGPGSVIFNGSNEEHALRNVGTGPTTYHVINWKSGARAGGN